MIQWAPKGYSNIKEQGDRVTYRLMDWPIRVRFQRRIPQANRRYLFINSGRNLWFFYIQVWAWAFGVSHAEH